MRGILLFGLVWEWNGKREIDEVTVMTFIGNAIDGSKDLGGKKRKSVLLAYMHP